MKAFPKIKTIGLTILLATFIFLPSFSLADPSGTCTLPLSGGAPPATGYSQTECTARGGVFDPDGGVAGSSSGQNTPPQSCLPTDRPDIPYTDTGDEKGTPCIPGVPGNPPTSGTGGSNISPTGSPSTASSGGGGGLVPCTDSNCGFNDFMTLINNVVKFILFAMAIPIAAIMFAYAGFVLVTSGGSTEARSKAKRIFTNVLIGLILAVAAWLIIELILKLVGFSGSWIGF